MWPVELTTKSVASFSSRESETVAVRFWVLFFVKYPFPGESEVPVGEVVSSSIALVKLDEYLPDLS